MIHLSEVKLHSFTTCRQSCSWIHMDSMDQINLFWWNVSSRLQPGRRNHMLGWGSTCRPRSHGWVAPCHSHQSTVVRQLPSALFKTWRQYGTYISIYADYLWLPSWCAVLMFCKHEILCTFEHFCSFGQSAFGGKYFIHWTTDEKSEEFFKFDVVDRGAYNEARTPWMNWHFVCLETLHVCLFEAAKSGKILIDSDMTLLDNGIEASG